MHSNYMFWRMFRDQKIMVTILVHQLPQRNDLHLYAFFALPELEEFVEITQHYGGKLLWYEDLTDVPLGFRLRTPIIGMLEFDCADLSVDLAGAFFRSCYTSEDKIMVMDDVAFPENARPLFVYDHTPPCISNHRGHEELDAHDELYQNWVGSESQCWWYLVLACRRGKYGGGAVGESREAEPSRYFRGFVQSLHASGECVEVPAGIQHGIAGMIGELRYWFIHAI